MKMWGIALVVAGPLLLAGCEAGSAASGGSSSRAGATTGSAKKTDGGWNILRAFRPEPVVLPEGTALPLVLQTAMASDTSHEGDLVSARLASDVLVGGKTLLAANTELRGKVTAAVPAGHLKGAARLAFVFDSVVVKGKEHAIETSAVDLAGPGQKKRDIELIGGGA